MLYVPYIRDYKPFYIQFASGAAKNILDEYSVIVKSHQYPNSFEAKEPYKNQWLDEHGDEEYIGPLGLYIEAFTFDLQCVMFAKGVTEDSAIAELHLAMRTFKNALKSGLFKTYDAWTGFGFQNVRLDNFPNEDEGKYDSWNDYTRCMFTVTLKVNDPVTNMVLSGNNIVEG